MTLADFETKSRANEPPDFHLQRMAVLLDALGNPHLGVPTVHVAGSKGKGSVCAMLASALSAHGFKTGLYTSPHLHHVRERIQIDGLPVSEDDFAELVDSLWIEVERVAARGDIGRVSVFELLTAMAFVHFGRERIQFQVIEVGLGGRLDATNLVQPDVAVITPIGLDHVAVLGDTIAQIAAEKAGILKSGRAAVTGRQPKDAARVIIETASQVGAPLRNSLVQTTDPTVTLDRTASPPVQRIECFGTLGGYQVRLPLLGAHQVDNARLAITALEALAAQGFPIRRERVEAGLAHVVWPARFQVLGTRPALVADGAHNEEAAAALTETVRFVYPDAPRIIVIFGGSGGHKFAPTARRLAALNPEFVVTRSRHPKAVNPEEVAAALSADNRRVTAVTSNTSEALDEALRSARPEDLVVATGSLFIAAEVIEEIQGIEAETYPTLRIGHPKEMLAVARDLSP